MFRAALRADGQAVAEVQRRLSSWASAAGWEFPAAGGSVDLGEDVVLVRVASSEGDEALELVVEPSRGPKGRTVVRALDSKVHGSLVWLEQDRPATADSELAARPEVFNGLLEDGWLTLDGYAAGPVAQQVGAPELAHLLGPDGPRPLVIAAMTAEGHPSPAIAALEARTTGMAHVVMCSGDIVTSSDSRVVVPPGGVATLGTSNTIDLIPATLCRQKPEASARRVQRLLLSHPSTDEAQADRHLRRMLLSSISDGVFDEWTVEFEATLQEKEQAQLDAQVAQDAYELSVIELDDAVREADWLRRQVRFFEARLRELGEYPGGFPLEDEGVPETVESFVELLEFCNEHLQWVSIGSSVGGPATDLDSYPSAPTWAKRCWQALQAFEDYARLKDKQEIRYDFQTYCGDTPSGATPFQLSLLSLHESESTMSNSHLVAKRTFAVPLEVDPAGKAVMQAHIKLQKAGALAPRMHYLDDTGGRTRRIHVGYIGQHLPTGG